MEIIEKEKIVEHQDGYYGPNKRDINGKANAGLTLGIIGTALGAWALFGNRRASAFGGLSGGGGSTNINVNGIEGMSNGLNAPTAFQAWEKGCEDTLALQSGLYNWALTQQNQRFQDRQTLNNELFGVYKSQVDADFGLYKSTREGSEHFNDSYAKYTVSKMFHTEGGRKYVGEKFDMLKAKEICERYRGIIPQSATHGDVYVAINAQYHDYCELFKAWFGDSVDSKIIESAINFWFKDDDFKSGCKVWKYFNMM